MTAPSVVERCRYPVGVKTQICVIGDQMATVDDRQPQWLGPSQARRCYSWRKWARMLIEIPNRPMPRSGIRSAPLQRTERIAQRIEQLAQGALSATSADSSKETDTVPAPRLIRGRIHHPSRSRKSASAVGGSPPSTHPKHPPIPAGGITQVSLTCNRPLSPDALKRARPVATGAGGVTPPTTQSDELEFSLRVWATTKREPQQCGRCNG